jgi:hypothetical protein
MNDGVVVYMPRIGVTMFVDPSQGAVGKYAMALSIN